MAREHLLSSQRLVYALIVASLSCLTLPENLSGMQLKFDKIFAEAEQANQALAKYNKENEISFHLESVSTAGRMADMYLMKNQIQKAQDILRPYLDEETRLRTATTSATKFGAPIPKIPSELSANQVYLWKMELLISLTHGKRFDEAAEMLNQFPKDKQVPATRLRYLKLIAQKCLDANDEKKGRELASLMWQEFKKLEEKDRGNQLIYAIDMVLVAQEFESKVPLKNLLRSVNPLFSTPFDQANLDDDQIGRLLRILGIANAHAGDFEKSLKLIERAREFVERTKDNFYTLETEQNNIEMAFAESFRLQKDMDQALLHTQRALDWMKKVDKSHESDVAKSIDGGQGFFSAVAAFGNGSEIKKIVLAQAKLGKLVEAKATWNSMSLSIQKLLCQIELAKLLVSQGKNKEALACAHDSLKLINDNTTLEDEVAITVSAMTIFDHCGNTDERDNQLKRLMAKEDLGKNANAVKSLASELVMLGMHDDAYKLIQTIEEEHLRSGPLSRLALALIDQK